MTDLVTKADYKAYKGINSSNDDAKLDALIPMVSKLVQTYCGKSFVEYATTNYTETFSLKWYQQVVFLKETPVIEIVSVQELISAGTYDTLTTDEYLLDTEMDAVYRVSDGEATDYPIGINAVKVTYKGGYTEIPADLQLAVFDLITYYLKEQYLPEKNHASFTIRYNPDSPGFPTHIGRILDQYKNV